MPDGQPRDALSEAPAERTAAAILDDLIERSFREWLYSRRDLAGKMSPGRRELMLEAFRGGLLRGLVMTGATAAVLGLPPP